MLQAHQAPAKLLDYFSRSNKSNINQSKYQNVEETEILVCALFRYPRKESHCAITTLEKKCVWTAGKIGIWHCASFLDELWVEWKGYDQSQNEWVARSSLCHHVPHLVHAFEASPSMSVARKSASKQVSTSVRDARLTPPPPVLPITPLHLKAQWFFEKKIRMGWCWLDELPCAQGRRELVNERTKLGGVNVLEFDYKQVSQVTCRNHVELVMNRKSRKDWVMCKGMTKDGVVNEVTTTNRINSQKSHNGPLWNDERTLWSKKER